MSHDLPYSIIAFVGYCGGAAAFVGVFCFLYMRMTAHDELRLITQNGNSAAALAFGGAILGYSISLAGAIRYIAGPAEFLLWGVIAMAGQCAAYGLARFFYPNVSKAIEDGVQAAGLWVLAVSLSAGLLIAACLVP